MAPSQPLTRRHSHDCSRRAAGAVGQAAAILGMLHRVPADHAAVHARLASLAEDITCEPHGEPDCDLTRALRDIVVHLGTAAELAHRHRATVLADELAEIIGIVEESGRNTARSLAAPPDRGAAARYRAEIARLARDADDAFRRLFARWYFDTEDPAAVAGMRDVGDELENVMRAFESVADAVHPSNELPG
ncbi:hypothetical protein [Nocardia araoensis]|uniref:hypothetical protein n=1 Tax=Nocardia araoensis TaxID=228600 RepID=UPI000584424A|nr:hypothetical protein [Nocardia araoensis]